MGQLHAILECPILSQRLWICLELQAAGVDPGKSECKWGLNPTGAQHKAQNAGVALLRCLLATLLAITTAFVTIAEGDQLSK